MRKSILRSLVLLMFMVVFTIRYHPVHKQFSTNTYYFSASGSGSGCTIGAPCPLSQVSSHGVAGDSLLFKKGDTFSGTITYTNSGSSGLPIVFDAYGNGVNPIFDAGGSSTATISVTGNYVTINNAIIQNSTNTSALLVLTSIHDVIVHNCYFNNGVRGIFANNCTGNLDLNNNYFTNIADPNIGSNGGGNRIQLHTCTLSVGNINIRYNQTMETRNANIGDQFSFFKCVGNSSNQFYASYNSVFGGSSNTAGYNAFGMGDNGGAYQNVHANIIVNSGLAGIVIAGVTNALVDSNRVFSAQFTTPAAPGAGIIVGNYLGGVNTNITAQHNFLNWTQFDNTVDNGFLDTSSGYTSTPTGWSTNTAPGVHDPNATATMYTGWTGSPWNSPIIVYGSSAFTFAVSGSVSQSPTNTGTASTNWTISPALPSGLSISSTTGVISGTPALVQSLTNYTVSATNVKGTGTYNLSITITGTSLQVVTGRKIIQL